MLNNRLTAILPVLALLALAGAACSDDTATADKGTPKDGAVADTAQLEAGSPEASTPDAATPDKGTPDTAVADQMLPDKMVPDQMLPDQMLPDKMLPDTKPPTPDKGLTADKGSSDGGFTGDLGPGGCLNDTHCTGSNEFCFLQLGCVPPGKCTVKPMICTGLWDPVCGCDNKTYGNECNAKGAGQSVAKKGSC